MNEFAHEQTRDGDGTRLRLAGGLTVWSATAARDALRDAIAGTERTLRIDLAAVDGVDIAGLQLICATHRAAARDGKTLHVTHSEVVRQTAEEGGFLRHVGCDGRRDCVWMEESLGRPGEASHG